MQNIIENKEKIELMEKMGININEIQLRKKWLEFSHEDEERLIKLGKATENYVTDIIDSLYEHFMRFEQPREFFENPATLKHVKHLQKNYFLRLLEGNYNNEYVEERLKIGSVHANIDLDVKWYLGAYNFYLRAVCKKIFELFSSDVPFAIDAIYSLMKIIFMDIGFAIDTYIYQRESTIRKQQQAIRELSTPVLQLKEGLLILPIVGAIDGLRARQLTEHLLYAIRDRRAKVVVVDVTGVPTIDSRVANHLIQAVDASRLMGATTIITGLSAEVAQTLVTIGVDLIRVITVGDLQGGIEEADRILGYQVMKKNEPSMTENTL